MKIMVAIDIKQHWDTIYAKTPTKHLGWYEHDPEPSLRLLGQCQLFSDSRIFVAGAGTTTLVDRLLEKGFEDIIVTDISTTAIDALKKRIDKNFTNNVEFIQSDLSRPGQLCCLPLVDCWYDRAVLHFFTREEDRQAYFDLVRKLVAVGGYVIIAAFHLDGADKCSGLPVHRYDAAMLSKGLGYGFRLRETFLYDYVMPSGGVRKYVYGLWQKLD